MNLIQMAKKEIQQDELSTKPATFFDLLNYLTIDKRQYDTLSESERKLISPYMLNRYLSMDMGFIEIVSEFQKYTISTLKNAEVYKLYLDILPKSKIYFKYIKAAADDKYDQKLISCFQTILNISSREALEYLIVLSKSNELNTICEDVLVRCGVEDKERNKILKSL